MRRSLIRVLLKVVAVGFYQEHTSVIVTLFIAVFINFFWTRVLSHSHITEAQTTLSGLRLAIMLVSEPVGVVTLASVGFLYSLKSWQYVTGRLKKPDVQFLAYSSNSFGWRQQLLAWMLIQGMILLPVIILCLYVMVIGLLFHHWVVPLLVPVYLLLLIVVGAGYYTRLLNDDVVKSAKVARFRWLRHWPKPLFSLYLYEIIGKKRVTYLLTKAASAVCMAFLLVVFLGARTDVRLLGMIGLCGAVGHVVLLFQAGEFESFYLSFVRNLPYGRGRVYGQQALLYAVLLLPEIVGLLIAGGISSGIPAAGLLLGATLLFRTLLYRTGQYMASYLRIVFGLFFLLFLLNLFGLTALLAVGCASAARVLLYAYWGTEREFE